MPAYCTTSNPPPDSRRPETRPVSSTEAMVAAYANAGASLAGLVKRPSKDSDLPQVASGGSYL